MPTAIPAGIAAVVLQAGGEDGAAAGQRGHRGQRPAGHLPALAGHRAAARRLVTLYNMESGPAAVRAAAGLAGRRHGPARRAPAAGGRGADAATAAPTSAPSPRRAAAASPASTSSTRSTPGTTSPPASSWPGWRTATGPVVLHPRRGRRRRGRCWTCCSPRTASRGCRSLALIDERLAAGETDGWHYDDMPEDAEAWRRDPGRPRRGRAGRSCGRAVRRARARRPGRAGAGGAGRRRRAGTTSRPRTCGACGPATPAPPSTPTRGRGTRSASPGRPIRAATRTSASTPARRSRCADSADADPVPFADRIERARRGARRGAARATPMRGADDAIRARNESAWLLPNDGTRTEPPAARRHAPLRRRRRGRPRGRRRRRRRRRADPAAGPRRLAGRLPGRRPVLGPRPRLGQRRARLAQPLLDRAPPDRRRRPGAAGQQQLRPRRRRLDGPLRRLHAPVPPVGLPAPAARTASAPTGRSPTPTCGRTTRRSRPSCPVAGQDWPWGDPHSYPHSPHPVGGNGRRLPARARARPASRPGSGRSRSPTAASATGRTASTAASACRAARSTPRPAR